MQLAAQLPPLAPLRPDLSCITLDLYLGVRRSDFGAEATERVRLAMYAVEFRFRAFEKPRWDEVPSAVVAAYEYAHSELSLLITPQRWRSAGKDRKPKLEGADGVLFEKTLDAIAWSIDDTFKFFKMLKSKGIELS